MNYSKENNKRRLKNKNATAKKTKNKAGTFIKSFILALLLIGAFSVFGLLAGAYLGILNNAPTIDAMSVEPDIFSTVMYDAFGGEMKTLEAKENREYVTLNQIPIHTQNAFIAIEDERFYEHNGIDLRGILRSAFVLITKQDKQGASTITQQLIKNSLGLQSNTVVSKLQEQYSAVNFESDLIEQYNGDKRKAKEHILELYLNTINLGNSLNGVQTATNYYFNKDVSELTIAESATIAAITQSPGKYNPAKNPEANKTRKDIILKYMNEQELITNSEYTDAMKEDVYSKISEVHQVSDAVNTNNTYFVDQLISEVISDLVERNGYTRERASYLIYNGGFQIYSTMDPDIQKVINDTYLDDSFFSTSDYKIHLIYAISIKDQVTEQTNHYQREKIIYNQDEIEPFIQSVQEELVGPDDIILKDVYYPVVQPQSAFTLMENGTGKVLGISGGRGEKFTNRSLNRATDSYRQPGSTFKPLSAFAPGIDLNIMTAGTVYIDQPLPAVNDHTFSNWYNGYRGPSTVREAIRDSMNLITVQAMEDVGIDKAFEYLLNFGFSNLADGEVVDGVVKTDRTLSASLGGLTWGVTNLELTAAYQTIANGGVYIKPTFYTHVLDHDGKVILDNRTPETRQVLEETTAYIMTDIMEDVVSSGTGSRAKFKNLNMPIAGKTGTTSSTNDLMFVGYTPYFTAAVWLGHDKPETINGANNAHLRIWSHIMENAHAVKGYITKDFVKPKGIVTAAINRDTGLLPAYSGDPNAYTEIFKEGTVPTEKSSYVANDVLEEINGYFFYIDPETGERVFVNKHEDGSYEIIPDFVLPEEKDTTDGIDVTEDGDLIITDNPNAKDIQTPTPVPSDDGVIYFDPNSGETIQDALDRRDNPTEAPTPVPTPTPTPTPIEVPDYTDDEISEPVVTE
ncbi:MAG: transglycosylase domain-containing protein [Lachnospirales bacterium]